MFPQATMAQQKRKKKVQFYLFWKNSGHIITNKWLWYIDYFECKGTWKNSRKRLSLTCLDFPKTDPPKWTQLSSEASLGVSSTTGGWLLSQKKKVEVHFILRQLCHKLSNFPSVLLRAHSSFLKIIPSTLSCLHPIFLSPCLDSMHACVLNHFRSVWLFGTLWTAAHQALLSMVSTDKNTGVDSHSHLQGNIPGPGNWTHIS